MQSAEVWSWIFFAAAIILLATGVVFLVRYIALVDKPLESVKYKSGRRVLHASERYRDMAGTRKSVVIFFTCSVVALLAGILIKS